MGCIYFITDGKFVKIGFSNNLKQRLVAMQSHSPYDLKTVYVSEGTEKLERLFHDLFKDLKVRGEWFKYSGNLYEFIEYCTENGYVIIDKNTRDVNLSNKLRNLVDLYNKVLNDINNEKQDIIRTTSEINSILANIRREGYVIHKVQYEEAEMNYTTTVRATGGSMITTVPSKLANDLNLVLGDFITWTMEISEKGTKLIVTPNQSKKNDKK